MQFELIPRRMSRLSRQKIVRFAILQSTISIRSSVFNDYQVIIHDFFCRSCLQRLPPTDQSYSYLENYAIAQTLSTSGSTASWSIICKFSCKFSSALTWKNPCCFGSSVRPRIQFFVFVPVAIHSANLTLIYFYRTWKFIFATGKIFF